MAKYRIVKEWGDNGECRWVAERRSWGIWAFVAVSITSLEDCRFRLKNVLAHKREVVMRFEL